MLRRLASTYQAPWEQAAQRESLLAATFKSMRAVSILGSELVKLPANECLPNVSHAGLSFATARATEGLASSVAGGILRERASELCKCVESLPLDADTRTRLDAALHSVQDALARV